MKINNLLVADKIYKDPNTQKLNIEGIFDTVYAKSFPALHKQLFVLTNFSGPNKKYKYHILAKYGSKIVMESELIIDKKIGKEHNIITELNNIPLFEPGEYIFEVELDKQSIKKSIKIKKANS